MIGFETKKLPRLVYGLNALGRIGEFAQELGGGRVLLVTDPGIVDAGHPARARAALEASGCTVSVFDAVVENPTTQEVKRCVEAARDLGANLLVGLGGGSSMDTAKGCNFILTNGGEMADYWGHGKADQPMLPFIAVPTTAGTGSECQSYALISDRETHMKMACGDEKAMAAIAILDPALTETQPPFVTACTGIDAITHAVEASVTVGRNELSTLYAHEAFRILQGNLERVVANPDHHEARGAMLLGAAYAGMAIENSMLGAAHSAANPLTAHHDVVHGRAVGLMLPHVMRFNQEEPRARQIYADLAVENGLATARDTPDEAAAALVDRVVDLIRCAGLLCPLADCGVTPESIEVMAPEAAAQWTAQFNPRPVTAADFVDLYGEALGAAAVAESSPAPAEELT